MLKRWNSYVPVILGLSSTNLSKKFNHFGTAICNFSKVPIHIYLQLSSDIIIHCNRDRLTLAPQVIVRCDKYLWWYHLMKFERWLELAQLSPEIWIFSINVSLSFGKHLYAYKYGKWPSPAALSPSKVPGSWYHQKETKLKSLYSASITTESQNGRVGRDIWRSLKQNSHKISLLKKLYGFCCFENLLPYSEESILLFRNQATKSKGNESFLLFCVTWLHSRRTETNISKHLSSLSHRKFRGLEDRQKLPLFLEVKGMGGCRWAVHGGAGKQSRRQDSKEVLNFEYKIDGNWIKWITPAVFISDVKTSKKQMGNKEGGRIEFSTTKPRSKEVLFCLVGSSASDQDLIHSWGLWDMVWGET